MLLSFSEQTGNNKMPIESVYPIPSTGGMLPSCRGDGGPKSLLRRGRCLDTKLQRLTGPSTYGFKGLGLKGIHPSEQSPKTCLVCGVHLMAAEAHLFGNTLRRFSHESKFKSRGRVMSLHSSTNQWFDPWRRSQVGGGPLLFWLGWARELYRVVQLSRAKDDVSGCSLQDIQLTNQSLHGNKTTSLGSSSRVPSMIIICRWLLEEASIKKCPLRLEPPEDRSSKSERNAEMHA